MVTIKLPFAATVTALHVHGIFASPQCYWPDGGAAQSNYVPCNSTATASACCAVNDACTTYGWCLGSAGMVYRGGCTDPSWKSGACQAKYCFDSKINMLFQFLPFLKGKLAKAVSDKASANTGDYQNLLSCSNGDLTMTNGYNEWCCGTSGSSTCCGYTFQLPVPSHPNIGLTGIAFMPDVEEPSVTITSTITATIISTILPSNEVISTTVTTVVVGTSTASSGPNAGLPKGAIAGVSVAAAIGGALISLVITSLLLRRPSMWFGLP
jgi:hypothetical protein